MHVGVLSITSSFISASFVDNDLFFFLWFHYYLHLQLKTNFQ